MWIPPLTASPVASQMLSPTDEGATSLPMPQVAADGSLYNSVPSAGGGDALSYIIYRRQSQQTVHEASGA